MTARVWDFPIFNAIAVYSIGRRMSSPRSNAGIFAGWKRPRQRGFFALRDINPEEIDDATLNALLERADGLMEVIYSIQRKRKLKEKQTRQFRL